MSAHTCTGHLLLNPSPCHSAWLSSDTRHPARVSRDHSGRPPPTLAPAKRQVAHVGRVSAHTSPSSGPGSAHTRSHLGTVGPGPALRPCPGGLPGLHGCWTLRQGRSGADSPGTGVGVSTPRGVATVAIVLESWRWLSSDAQYGQAEPQRCGFGKTLRWPVFARATAPTNLTAVPQVKQDPLWWALLWPSHSPGLRRPELRVGVGQEQP